MPFLQKSCINFLRHTSWRNFFLAFRSFACSKPFFLDLKYLYPSLFNTFRTVLLQTLLTPLSRSFGTARSILLSSWTDNFFGLPLFSFLLSNTGSPFKGFLACLYTAALEYCGNNFNSSLPRTFDNWYAALIWAECSRGILLIVLKEKALSNTLEKCNK